MDLEPVDHNISRDPESSALLFASGAPIAMCGYDVTRQVLVTHDHMRQLKESGDALNIAMANMMSRWFSWWKRDFTAMNDPLCVALVFNESLCRGMRMNVEIQYDHRHPTGHTICTLPRTPWTPPNELTQLIIEPNVNVLLEVDAQRFIDLLMKRVCYREL
jgi:purine nucleosidase